MEERGGISVPANARVGGPADEAGRARILAWRADGRMIELFKFFEEFHMLQSSAAAA